MIDPDDLTEIVDALETGIAHHLRLAIFHDVFGTDRYDRDELTLHETIAAKLTVALGAVTTVTESRAYARRVMAESREALTGR